MNKTYAIGSTITSDPELYKDKLLINMCKIDLDTTMVGPWSTANLSLPSAITDESIVLADNGRLDTILK